MTQTSGLHPVLRARAQNGAGIVQVVARMKPGVAIQQAQSEMDAITARLAESDPARNKGMLGALVEPLHEYMFGGLREPLLLLQGAVGFVLLIGCANVAGLLLARGTSRRTEVAIRAAIGAGRWQIMRQLLTESMILAVFGGLFGVFLAWSGLRLFISSAPADFPRLNEISLDLRVLAFTSLVAVLTGLLFGIAPAVQASRADLVEALKESARGSGSLSRHRVRSVLVALQIGLALVLLIGAGLMINSFIRIQKSDLGLDPRGLLTFDYRFPVSEIMKNVGTYRGSGLWEINPNAAQMFDRLRERLKGLPGVESVAAANRPPLQGAMGVPFLVEGRPTPSPSNGMPPQTAAYVAVTPDYFHTLKTPVIQGRDFNDRDNAAATPVIVINQAMARRYWPSENPVGKRITLDYVPDEQPREIVGIVADTRLFRTQRDPEPIMYVPHVQQSPRWLGASLVLRAGMFFVVRSAGDPLALVPSLRQAGAEVDRNKPLASIQTVERTIDQQVRYVRLYVLLLAVFGGAAALLGCRHLRSDGV
jgi:putative ABC transport system permease protein